MHGRYDQIYTYFASHIHEIAHDYLGFSFQDQQVHRLAQYGKYLLKWNERMNLTAITDPRQIILKHFFDSALVSVTLTELFSGLFPAESSPPPFFSPLGSSSTDETGPVFPHIIDIGSGAGFPGVVIKIMQPYMKMTLVEASAKKVSFLEHLVRKLEMDAESLQILQIRAEELGQRDDFREKVDGVVSRAVADLPVLLEYAVPLLKVGGYCVAAKGRRVFEEMERAERALAVLGARVESVQKFALAPEAEFRALLVIKKMGPTPPSYPRRPGQPAKKPL